MRDHREELAHADRLTKQALRDFKEALDEEGYDTPRAHALRRRLIAFSNVRRQYRKLTGAGNAAA